MSAAATNEEFAALIRDLVSCQQRAGPLGLGFLTQLLGMAILETALQWDGGVPLPTDQKLLLDHLLRLKVRVALAGAGNNVIAFKTGSSE